MELLSFVPNRPLLVVHLDVLAKPLVTIKWSNWISFTASHNHRLITLFLSIFLVSSSVQGKIEERRSLATREAGEDRPEPAGRPQEGRQRHTPYLPG